MGEVGALVVHQSVVALRHGANEVVDTGRLGRLDYLFTGGSRLGIGDILGNGAAKEPGILEHHAKVVAQAVSGEVLGRDAIQGDEAAVDLVEAHQ